MILSFGLVYDCVLYGLVLLQFPNYSANNNHVEQNSKLNILIHDIYFNKTSLVQLNLHFCVIHNLILIQCPEKKTAKSMQELSLMPRFAVDHA